MCPARNKLLSEMYKKKLARIRRRKEQKNVEKRNGKLEGRRRWREEELQKHSVMEIVLFHSGH